MWKIYGAPGPGIAVLTSARKIGAALSGLGHTFYLGKVGYIDPEMEPLDIGNIFNCVTVKRKSFSYEHEVRLVFWNHLLLDEPNLEWDCIARTYNKPPFSTWPEGMEVSCDLQMLISRVVVSPFVPPWYARAVEALVATFCPNVSVEQSTLLRPPI
ncbi:MAG: DUF2971 domain-containing protein [Caulobacteraceae bacterium]